jgi:hypothetical protein
MGPVASGSSRRAGGWAAHAPRVVGAGHGIEGPDAGGVAVHYEKISAELGGDQLPQQQLLSGDKGGRGTEREKE